MPNLALCETLGFPKLHDRYMNGCGWVHVAYFFMWLKGGHLHTNMFLTLALSLHIICNHLSALGMESARHGERERETHTHIKPRTTYRQTVSNSNFVFDLIHLRIRSFRCSWWQVAQKIWLFGFLYRWKRLFPLIAIITIFPRLEPGFKR